MSIPRQTPTGRFAATVEPVVEDDASLEPPPFEQREEIKRSNSPGIERIKGERSASPDRPPSPAPLPPILDPAAIAVMTPQQMQVMMVWMMLQNQAMMQENLRRDREREEWD